MRDVVLVAGCDHISIDQALRGHICGTPACRGVRAEPLSVVVDAAFTTPTLDGWTPEEATERIEATFEGIIR